MRRLATIVIPAVVIGLLVASPALSEPSPAGEVIPIITPERPVLTYSEAPELAELVNQGDLPPVAERLPRDPPVVQPLEELGRYGGTIRFIEMYYTDFASSTRFMQENLFSLTAPTGQHMYPNLAKSLEIGDDLQSFTITLREGVKWSDGHELTTEDIIFAWEDMLRYSPDPSVDPDTLAPAITNVGGKPFTLEAIDDYTLVIRTATPFADMPAVLTHVFSEPRPRPAHYLRQFHPKYAGEGKDATEMWQEFQEVHSVLTNPDLPTYGPWITDAVKEGDALTMRRNPYYWKVDTQGRQLPYADRVRMSYIKDGEVQKLQLSAGAFDFTQWPPTDAVLFQQQRAGNYEMPARNSYYFGIRINIPWVSKSHDDPNERKLAELLKDERFLRAMQLAIDNRQMTTAYVSPELFDFIGGTVGHPNFHRDSVAGSQLSDPRVAALWEFLEEWQHYDLDEAKRLLDELGLRIGDDGFRHYPDGGRIEITMGTWSDWQPVGEVGQMAAVQLENDLKIKFFVQTKTWSEGVQQWYVQGDIPVLMVGIDQEYWATNIFNTRTMFQIPAIDWIKSDGAQGVEPYDALKEPLRELVSLETQSRSTPDPERKLDLAIQAADILIRNHIGYPWLMGYQANTVYTHNRIVNMPAGYPGTGSPRFMRLEQWSIGE